MSHKVYIGIDNGTTGTIAWIRQTTSGIEETPIITEQSYTKAKNIISRIDHVQLRIDLRKAIGDSSPSECIVVIERPMINPMRFKASISAARSLEATLCVVEDLGLPHMYADSRDWQKKMLPQGCKGDDLKTASRDIGYRLFPHCAGIINKHKDADALLIAEWARREQL